MSQTKEQLQTEFSLSDQDFKDTLKAIGLHPNKKNFSQEERERFVEARKLFDEGGANSYEDIATYFKQQATKGVQGNESLMANLDQQAVQAGFELGARQAEIMGQVIPKATVMRLTQMIESGQLKDSFQQYWAETMKVGKAPDVTTLVEDYLETHQLAPSSAPMNLLSSSTESSTNDSESP